MLSRNFLFNCTDWAGPAEDWDLGFAIEFIRECQNEFTIFKIPSQKN
jgi:hypothetical protein